MRRHFVFPREDEREPSVGDAPASASSSTSLLRAWLVRREALAATDAVARHLGFFWSLATPANRNVLSRSEYVAFFACAATALVRSVNASEAAKVAARDWLYDSHGESCRRPMDGADDCACLTMELFREALMEVAELVLPVESDSSMIASFFLELRESIAESKDLASLGDLGQDQQVSSPDLTLEASLSVPQVFEAVRYVLRPLKAVKKIRGAFLQSDPPGHDQLANVSGLAPPDARAMSLKQLLLAYNPRKLALSRAMATLASVTDDKTQAAVLLPLDETESAKDELDIDDEQRTIPSPSPAILNAQSEDLWDSELAFIASLEKFPARRVAVVGPPLSGKTRLAKLLAARLGLRYLSLPVAIQLALAAFRRRKERQDIAAAAAAEAAEAAAAKAVAAEAAAAEAAAVAAGTETTEVTDEAPAGDQAETTTEPAPTAPDEDEPLAALLNEGDVLRLRSGLTLSRTTSLTLLIHVATASLLEGVGVVLDDVHPAELASAVGVDFVVALRAPKTDLAERAAGLTIAPTGRIVYSSRDLAMAKASSSLEQLAAMGFADVEPQSDNQAEESKPSEVVESPRVPDDSEGDTAELTSTEDEGQDRPPPPPSPPTPAERNGVPSLSEPVVPLQSLTIEYFATRIRGYCEWRASIKAMTLSSSPKWHEVAVLAGQALASSVNQCVEVMCGTSLGVSRTAYSHAAVPIALPEEVAAAPRVDQLRWLLFGDWVSLLAAEDEADSVDSFARLPRRHASHRRLSRWREFCPVTSDPGVRLELGSPAFAAVMAGRVYLLASAAARSVFIAHPLQYLRRKPQAPPVTRVWLLYPKLPNDHKISSTISEALGLPMVSPMTLLTGDNHQSALTTGGVISAADATANLFASGGLSAGSSWLLTDLPLSSEVLNVLESNTSLPQVVMVLEGYSQPPEGDKLAAKRVEVFTAQLGAAEELLMPLGVKLHRVNVSLTDGDEAVVAAVRSALDPFALRVDNHEDGHAPPQVAASTDGDIPDSAWLDDGHADASWLLGETGRYCAVSWANHRTLVPGRAAFVSSIKQQLYAFAGEQELRAFTRDPTKFIPQLPRTTTRLVPLILLLGVRGTGRRIISRALVADSQSRAVAVDLGEMKRGIVRRLKLASLQRGQDDSAPDEAAMMADTLHDQLANVDQCWNGGVPPAVVWFGASEPGGEADDVMAPTAEVLTACFARGIFPTLVIPLEVSEQVVVARRLKPWLAAQEKAKAMKVRKRPARDGDQEEPEEQEEEDEAAARAEEEERLGHLYRADDEANSAALELLRSRGVAIAAPVNGDGSERQRVKNVAAALAVLMSRRDSLLERCESVDVSSGRLRTLLRSGELQIGRHDANCPVTGSGGRDSDGKHAVVYRSRVYFPSTAAAAAEFAARPWQFVYETQSVPPPVVLACCVVGSPETPTARLALELSRATGAVVVSPASALSWVRSCLGGSALWSSLKPMDAADASPDVATSRAAVFARLQSAECQARGWILEDFVLFPDEHVPSESVHVEPGMLIVLDASFQATWGRRQAHSTPLIDTLIDREGLVAAFATWERRRLELLSQWTASYGDALVTKLDADASSLWRLSALAQQVVARHLSSLRRYRQRQVAGLAAEASDVPRTFRSLVARQHPSFETFCPVELSAGRYAVAAHANDRSLCVDFGDHTFWLSSRANLEVFIADPPAYLAAEVADKARQTRERMPVEASILSLITVSDCDYPELRGYCPVTFARGQGPADWGALVKGSVFFRASYERRVFVFASESARCAFLADPAQFARLKLPVKLPPQVTAALARNYPGRLEQELSAELQTALLALGSARPKFPSVPLAASACVFLALTLLGEDTDDVAAAFAFDCGLAATLRRAVAPMSPSCGSGIRAVRELASAATENGDGQVDGGWEQLEAARSRFDALTRNTEAARLSFAEVAANAVKQRRRRRMERSEQQQQARDQLEQ